MGRRVLGVATSLLVISMMAGCKTTQKTPGEGLTSVVAQNVVRIACVSALREADLSALENQDVQVNLTGFVDDENTGILDLMTRLHVERAGGRVVPPGEGVLEIEVAALSAGNDVGTFRVPLITQSARTESTVDLNVTIIDVATGQDVSTQAVYGKSKYQQREVLGFQGYGHYYVLADNGRYVLVDNPSDYR